jgi:rod shape-determining protein MreD
MKAGSVLLTVAIALFLQSILARYAVGGRWPIDLVLVAVVYAAAYWGAASGLLAGTLGGLAQDALSGGVLGVNGLTKTIVGFAAGLIGAQFIIAKSGPRILLVVGATLVHRGLMLGLVGLIDQRWSGIPWTAILEETALNAICGFVAFHMTEGLPGALEQRRQGRRARLSRRRW